MEVDDDAGEKGVRWEKRLIIRNTAAKFGLDQTVGAVVNVVAFLAGVRLLRGASLAESWFVVKEVGSFLRILFSAASSTPHPHFI